MRWNVVYKRAIEKDGTLLFPERLTKAFLENARRIQGSYIFANQYLNEVIPDDQKAFKKDWLKYIKSIPDGCYSFGFIDPAIGQKAHHDYTGIIIVDVAPDKQWYLRHAERARLTPTQIVEKMFKLCDEFKLKTLGVEVVAYQEALLYILDEKMRQKNAILPVKGITRKNVSKTTRILGLVPRFEYGRIHLRPGMVDFEDEYNFFPRHSHDDLLDALASIDEICFYPEKENENVEKPNPADAQSYERWVIRELGEGRDPSNQESEGYGF